MKKVLKRLFIGLMLVTLALSFAACMGTAASTTPAYVNKYYVGGVETENKYIDVQQGNVWFMRVKDGSDNITVYFGAYDAVSNNELKFFYSDGTPAPIKGELSDNVWTITNTDTGDEFIKKAASSGCQSGNVSTYVIFGVLVVAIIGLFVWSSISKKKQAKKSQETVNALKVGDKVKTIGGICGFVSEIDNTENTFVLEVKTAEKSSFIKFDKGAIYQTAPAEGSKSEEKTEEPKNEDK